MKKRITSIALIFAMIMSFISMPVFADVSTAKSEGWLGGDTAGSPSYDLSTAGDTNLAYNNNIYVRNENRADISFKIIGTMPAFENASDYTEKNIVPLNADGTINWTATKKLAEDNGLEEPTYLLIFGYYLSNISAEPNLVQEMSLFQTSCAFDADVLTGYTGKAGKGRNAKTADFQLLINLATDSEILSSGYQYNSIDYDNVIEEDTNPFTATTEIKITGSNLARASLITVAKEDAEEFLFGTVSTNASDNDEHLMAVYTFSVEEDTVTDVNMNKKIQGYFDATSAIETLCEAEDAQEPNIKAQYSAYTTHTLGNKVSDLANTGLSMPQYFNVLGFEPTFTLTYNIPQTDMASFPGEGSTKLYTKTDTTEYKTGDEIKAANVDPLSAFDASNIGYTLTEGYELEGVYKKYTPAVEADSDNGIEAADEKWEEPLTKADALTMGSTDMNLYLKFTETQVATYNVTYTISEEEGANFGTDTYTKTESQLDGATVKASTDDVDTFASGIGYTLTDGYELEGIYTAAPATSTVDEKTVYTWDSSKKIADDTEIIINSGDVGLFLRFQKKTYDVTFHVNDDDKAKGWWGTDTRTYSKNVNIEYGQKLNDITIGINTDTDNGWSVEKWTYKTNDTSGKKPGEEGYVDTYANWDSANAFDDDSPTDLYAVFTQETYEVTYKIGTDSGAYFVKDSDPTDTTDKADKTETVAKGSSANVNVEVKNTDSTKYFKGWYVYNPDGADDDAKYTNTPFDPESVTSDVIVYPQWETKYKVTYNAVDDKVAATLTGKFTYTDVEAGTNEGDPDVTTSKESATALEWVVGTDYKLAVAPTVAVTKPDTAAAAATLVPPLGYELEGWYTIKTEDGGTTYTWDTEYKANDVLSSDLELYPKYKKSTKVLTFNSTAYDLDGDSSTGTDGKERAIKYVVPKEGGTEGETEEKDKLTETITAEVIEIEGTNTVVYRIKKDDADAYAAKLDIPSSLSFKYWSTTDGGSEVAYTTYGEDTTKYIVVTSIDDLYPVIDEKGSNNVTFTVLEDNTYGTGGTVSLPVHEGNTLDQEGYKVEPKAGGTAGVTYNVPVPTRSGYTFDGWYEGTLNSENTKVDTWSTAFDETATATTTYSAATAYYAKWTVDQTDLTFIDTKPGALKEDDVIYEITPGDDGTTDHVLSATDKTAAKHVLTTSPARTYEVSGEPAEVVIKDDVPTLTRTSYTYEDSGVKYSMTFDGWYVYDDSQTEEADKYTNTAFDKDSTALNVGGVTKVYAKYVPMARVTFKDSLQSDTPADIADDVLYIVKSGKNIETTDAALEVDESSLTLPAAITGTAVTTLPAGLDNKTYSYNDTDYAFKGWYTVKAANAADFADDAAVLAYIRNNDNNSRSAVAAASFKLEPFEASTTVSADTTVYAVYVRNTRLTFTDTKQYTAPEPPETGTDPNIADIIYVAEPQSPTKAMKDYVTDPVIVRTSDNSNPSAPPADLDGVSYTFNDNTYRFKGWYYVAGDDDVVKAALGLGSDDTITDAAVKAYIQSVDNKTKLDAATILTQVTEDYVITENNVTVYAVYFRDTKITFKDTKQWTDPGDGTGTNPNHADIVYAAVPQDPAVALKAYNTETLKVVRVDDSTNPVDAPSDLDSTSYTFSDKSYKFKGWYYVSETDEATVTAALAGKTITEYVQSIDDETKLTAAAILTEFTEDYSITDNDETVYAVYILGSDSTLKDPEDPDDPSNMNVGAIFFDDAAKAAANIIPYTKDADNDGKYDYPAPSGDDRIKFVSQMKDGEGNDIPNVYYMVVKKDVDTAYAELRATDSNAGIKIYQKDADNNEIAAADNTKLTIDATPAAGTDASFSLALDPTKEHSVNTVYVTVTASNGDSTEYTFNILRLVAYEFKIGYGNTPKGLIYRDDYQFDTQEKRDEALDAFIGTVSNKNKEYDSDKIPVIEYEKEADGSYKIVDGKRVPKVVAQNTRPYTTNAWTRSYGGYNYDTQNEYAYFIYNGDKFNLPKTVFIDEYGFENTVSIDCTIKRQTDFGLPNYKGKTDAANYVTDWNWNDVPKKKIGEEADSTPIYDENTYDIYDKMIRPDIYDMKYIFEYKPLDPQAAPIGTKYTVTINDGNYKYEFTRKLGVIGKLGDVALSGTADVQTADIKVMRDSASKINTGNSLLAFRIADTWTTTNPAVNGSDTTDLVKNHRTYNNGEFKYYPNINDYE